MRSVRLQLSASLPRAWGRRSTMRVHSHPAPPTVIFEPLEGRTFLSATLVSQRHPHYHSNHHYHSTRYAHPHTVAPNVLFDHFMGVAGGLPAFLTLSHDASGNVSGLAILIRTELDRNFAIVAYSDGTFTVDANGQRPLLAHLTLRGYTSNNGKRIRGKVLGTESGGIISGPFVMNRILDV